MKSKFAKNRALGIGDKSALPMALIAVALSLAPLEQARAQLFIDVYQSQDNPTTQTLWIFSGSSSARNSGGLRTSSSSSNANLDDTWWFGSPNNGNIYDANQPSNTNFSLSPLFSSANTIDIDSIRKRIPGGGRTNITFAANATNTPTITIGSGNRTISHIFMDEDSTLDEMGIRVSGSNLNYSSGNSSAWVGAGILDKPIGDFFAGTYNNNPSAYFAANAQGSIQVRINSAFIPEPREYALIFGLFALAFVFFHRHRKRNNAQRGFEHTLEGFLCSASVLCAYEKRPNMALVKIRRHIFGDACLAPLQQVEVATPHSGGDLVADVQ